MALPNILDSVDKLKNLSRNIEDTFNPDIMMRNMMSGVSDTISKSTEKVATKLTGSVSSRKFISDVDNKFKEQNSNINDNVNENFSEVFIEDKSGFLSSIDENIAELVRLFGGQLRETRFKEQNVNSEDDDDLLIPEMPEMPKPEGLGLLDLIPLGMGTAIAASVGAFVPAALSAMIMSGTIAAVGAGIVGGAINFDLGSEVGKVLGSTDGLSSAVLAIFTGLDDSIISAAATIGTYAGTGAVIGSVVPGAGTITGFLVGAAVGAAVTALTNMVGFERMSLGLDKIIDNYNSFIENFIGRDVDRILERIEETQTGSENLASRLSRLTDQQIKLMKDIEEAQINGDKETVRILSSRLVGIKERIETTRNNREILLQQEKDLNVELSSAEGNWTDGLADIGTYTAQLPGRLVDYLWSLTLGAEDPIQAFSLSPDKYQERFNTFFVDIWDKTVEDTSDIYDSVSDWVKNFDVSTYIPVETHEKSVAFVSDTWEIIKGFFGEMYDDAIEWLKDFELPEIDFGKIFEKITGIPDRVFGWLESSINGMLDGFEESIRTKFPRIGEFVFGSDDDPNASFNSSATENLSPANKMLAESINQEIENRVEDRRQNSPLGQIQNSSVVSNSVRNTNVINQPLRPTSADSDAIRLYLESVR